ncbi:MAG: Swt1 family HEPN domain-containing protein [Candidatus Dormibacteria bacterium]
MTTDDDLRSWLFRCVTFEADADLFRQAGVRVGADEERVERELRDEALAPFPLPLRNAALRMARLYAVIYCFENSVRELIRARLSEVDAEWWSTKVPSAVRRSADERRAEAERNSWLDGADRDVLGFVDFGGLCGIFVSQWAAFGDLIPSQHWLRQRLDELESSRNWIAHNRLLADEEFARLEMYVADWNRQVGL